MALSPGVMGRVELRDVADPHWDARNQIWVVIGVGRGVAREIGRVS